MAPHQQRVLGSKHRNIGKNILKKFCFRPTWIKCLKLGIEDCIVELSKFAQMVALGLNS